MTEPNDHDGPSPAQKLGVLGRLFADAVSIVAKGKRHGEISDAWRKLYGENKPAPNAIIYCYGPSPDSTTGKGRPERVILIKFDDGRWQIRRWPGDGKSPSLLEQTLDQARRGGKSLLEGLVEGVLGDVLKGDGDR